MRKIQLAALLAIALAIPVIAGCGGGGGEETQTALSPAAFVTKARGVCAEARQEIAKALIAYQKENGSLDPSNVGMKAVEGTLLPVQHTELSRLQALVPPEEVAGRWKRFLEARAATLAKIESQSISSNDALFKVFAPSDQMAIKLQLEECSFN